MGRALTQVLTSNFFITACIWAAQQTRGIIHLALSFSCWFRVIGVPFFVFLSCFSLSGMLNDQEDCGSRVFMSAEVAVVGYKILSTVKVRTLLEAFFEHVPEICFNCLSIQISGE